MDDKYKKEILILKDRLNATELMLKSLSKDNEKLLSLIQMNIASIKLLSESHKEHCTDFDAHKEPIIFKEPIQYAY
ncbi:MAG: hypothetical protein CL811_06600 [Colwelliaceae bacterium]|jgi:hypothetical protein|nr:hypothetical protein [Colwelliaceae bacterium]|tara:strand:- start:5325 stop:5552 length:228 start_codon:yes stop_codon:yes gene_type:complete